MSTNHVRVGRKQGRVLVGILSLEQRGVKNTIEKDQEVKESERP